MKLYIGNKTYSSWSLRPWIAARMAGIPFEEEVIWLRQPDTSPRIRAVAANARVPALVDGGVTVFESIAILEYLAEAAPSLWPADRAARAHARSVSAEMHAGFSALRHRCPMTMKRKPAPIVLDAAVQADIARVVALWSDCRTRFGGNRESPGPFLFGAFTNADAMFAPVVSRFHAYAVDVPPAARDYMAAMQATPAWQEWLGAALQETHAIADTDDVV